MMSHEREIDSSGCCAEFGGVDSSGVRVNHPEQALPPAFAREDLLAARFNVTKVLPYQRSIPPFIRNLSLAIFSGLLLTFAFPEWNLWSLGWVGAAPLIMAVARERRFLRALLLGTVTGTVFYAGSSYWVTYSMHRYGGVPLWLSYLILVILAAALGVFTGVFAAGLSLVVKRFGGWSMLIAPAIWVASEWARIEVTGVGWNALGYSQAFMPSVIQIARWGGVYAVSGILAMASTTLVFALVYLEQRRGLIVLTVAGAIAVACVLYGQVRLRSPGDKSSVPVVVVQPNIPVDGSWFDPTFIDQMTDRHVLLSEQAIQKAAEVSQRVTAEDSNAVSPPPVDLVIWPESPMNFEYDRDERLRQKLRSFTTRNRVYLLLNSWGFPADTNDHERVYNSAIVIGPSGDKISEYDKIALVPFGEYVPARGWIPFMDRIPALVGDITPGARIAVSEAGEARMGTLICFEATRPELGRRMRREGASTFVQLSNELWFGPTSAPKQMLAHAIFRAVENDVDMVRATNSGMSAKIDSRGQAGEPTPIFEVTSRIWRVRSAGEASRELTFYTRHGDVFAAICALISLLAILSTRVRTNSRLSARAEDPKSPPL
jgi:apolipoprotein N-acyltransferase